MKHGKENFETWKSTLQTEGNTKERNNSSTFATRAGTLLGSVSNTILKLSDALLKSPLATQSWPIWKGKQ